MRGGKKLAEVPATDEVTVGASSRAADFGSSAGRVTLRAYGSSAGFCDDIWQDLLIEP